MKNKDILYYRWGKDLPLEEQIKKKEKQAKVFSSASKKYWASLSDEEREAKLKKLQDGRKRNLGIAFGDNIEKYDS